MPSRIFFLFLGTLLYNISFAQFAPPAGEPGSTAIHKDSSIIVGWAKTCSVNRGLMDISQPSLGVVSSGLPEHAVGAAGDGMAVTLGDAGTATLTFDYPIYNGIGADFAVFENAFGNIFLELAFVEVSSDGVNFVRFPAISNSDTTVQIGTFGSVDATLIHNLAGKYQANYGVPFDLEELAGDSAILNINAISHVRVVDVIGCIQEAYATRDSRGVKVNDPWSTPFAPGGFDLDAVGVIHSNANIAVTKIENENFDCYPNPISTGQSIEIKTTIQNYAATLYNLHGQVLWQEKNSPLLISTQNLIQGTYVLVVENQHQRFLRKILVI